jgi:hypothetical protein
MFSVNSLAITSTVPVIFHCTVTLSAYVSCYNLNAWSTVCVVLIFQKLFQAADKEM